MPRPTAVGRRQEKVDYDRIHEAQGESQCGFAEDVSDEQEATAVGDKAGSANSGEQGIGESCHHVWSILCVCQRNLRMA